MYVNAHRQHLMTVTSLINKVLINHTCFEYTCSFVCTTNLRFIEAILTI